MAWLAPTHCCARGAVFRRTGRLGLNLEVKDGEMRLLEPFTACTEGQPITPEQAKLLVSAAEACRSGASGCAWLSCC